jgi:hypothetical protein
MADLVALSQSINANSSSSTSSGSGGKVSFVPPTPPPPPKPKPGKTKEQEKKEEKNEHDKREKERVGVFRWCVHAHRSKYLSKYIPDDIKEPRSSDSLESLHAHQEMIRGFVNMGSKEAAVENIIKGLVQGGESIAVLGFKMEAYKGFSNMVMQDTEFLQPDLEEMAIELPDDYIPAAKWRVFLKLFMAAQAYAERNVHGSQERNFQ